MQSRIEADRCPRGQIRLKNATQGSLLLVKDVHRWRRRQSDELDAAQSNGIEHRFLRRAVRHVVCRETVEEPRAQVGVEDETWLEAVPFLLL